MALRPIEMKLVELLVLKRDITAVIEYFGKTGYFQFQLKDKKNIRIEDEGDNDENVPVKKQESPEDNDKTFFDKLQEARTFLKIDDNNSDCKAGTLPTDQDREEARKTLNAVELIKKTFTGLTDELKRVDDAHREALSFSNLQVPYSELANLSFLIFRVGKIDPAHLNDLQDDLGERAVIIPLGEDNSRILAASSRKGRFALDTELARYGFENIEIPENFKGIPDDLLKGFETQKNAIQEKLDSVEKEKSNFADVHAEQIRTLLCSFSAGMQVSEMMSRLEATELTYHVTGWIQAKNSERLENELSELTEGRIAIRGYKPSEVPDVISGKERVPVSLHHGKFVSAFERMIYSYGAPVYGSIDPTPFVSIFFTLLFGIMFGDLGQGLVFLLLGILMSLKVVKAGGWNKFAPIFIAIGISSSIMGLLTGEFFATEHALEPFAHWVTGLFGTPRAPILKMMPSSDPSSTTVMFGVFGVTIGIGFLINVCGLVINIINKAAKKEYGAMLFGKTGIAGTSFFCYVVVMVIRIAFFHHSIAIYDWIIIGITLFFSAFGEPFERLVDGHRPVIENGAIAVIIGAIVELIEVISTNISNTVSFLRVGAFALAHAVLGYIIATMTEIAVPGLNIVVLILGNALVILLEGMIVAIQVIRLQYYEFFSKFFKETGTEFKPFVFEYGKIN